MELEARLEALADKVRKHVEVLETEEAAKFALVNPFIEALGYDLSNPAEVVPELPAMLAENAARRSTMRSKLGAKLQSSSSVSRPNPTST